jgi:nucleotidyltransferase/DNA polymerase involved in DNA repair
VIDADNLEMVYHMMELTDLPYIKARNKTRLNEAGIFTAHQFFLAPERVLTKRVFRSINGHHWYLKLRGYETEVEYGIRTVGRSYVLEHRTADPEELAMLFHKACHKLAWRLKKNDFAARGLSLNLGYAAAPHKKANWGRRAGWHERQMWKVAVRRGDELFARTMQLFGHSPAGQVVSSLFITAYGLEPAKLDQPTLFEDWHTKKERVEEAMNAVNLRYGEHTLVPAAVAASKNPMKDKIPFGSIRYFS